MDIRYQVFVSSTFADLEEERRRVIQTLMQMDCIPSGMELFPAADEDQLDFIKKVIDDCDYYILIIGGRYGTVTAEGISFTEREYEYAISKGMKVIALLHKSPDDIAVGKTDKDPILLEKLAAFRQRVSTGRLVKHWKTADELPGLVALSLTRTMKTHPAIGWIRGDAAVSREVLADALVLSKENARLKSEIAELLKENKPQIDTLVSLDTNFKIHATVRPRGRTTDEPWTEVRTWGNIFGLLAPHLMKHPHDETVKLTLRCALIDEKLWERVSLDDNDYQTIKIQLIAYGLVRVERKATKDGLAALFWSLTPLGEQEMLRLRTIQVKSGNNGG